MGRFKFEGVEARTEKRGPYVFVSFRKTVARSAGREFPWVEVAKLPREPSMGEIQRGLRNYEWPDDYGSIDP